MLIVRSQNYFHNTEIDMGSMQQMGEKWVTKGWIVGWKIVCIFKST